MPNDLPTDRLPTMAETRAMHEQAVRARKKQRLKKTLITIAVTLLVITLLAALALFVRAKLQTLDKPLDAKTNQTAQTQPQEPLIEPASQARPNRRRIHCPNRKPNPRRIRPRNPSRKKLPRRKTPAKRRIRPLR